MGHKINQYLTTTAHDATIVTSMQLQGLRDLPESEKGDFQMEKTIGAWEARRRFGQLIEEAFYHGSSCPDPLRLACRRV